LLLGQTTNALAENARAREVDPFSYPVNAMRGAVLWYMGRTEESIAQFQTLESLNAQSTVSHEVLAHLYWADRKPLAAIDEERKLAAVVRDTEMARDAEQVSDVYGKYGFRQALLQDVRFRERTHARTSGKIHPGHGFYTGSTIALQYAILGDREQTLRWLERAVHEPLGHLPEDLMCAREFDFVRSDPQFRSILRNLGLPTQ
jgi:hypothetical protein